MPAQREPRGAFALLHADTALPDNWTRVVADTLGEPGIVAGSFGFRVAEEFTGRWLVEWTVNLRSRWLQKPYGDQTQFLRRALFEESAALLDLPIMEDYQLNQRLQTARARGHVRGNGHHVGATLENAGVIRTTLINRMMIAGYHLGVCPRKLARFYRI